MSQKTHYLFVKELKGSLDGGQKATQVAWLLETLQCRSSNSRIGVFAVQHFQ